MINHLKMRLLRPLMLSLLVGVVAAGLGLTSVATAPQASAATNVCRNGEIKCRYKVIKFNRGSRRYNLVAREIRLRPKGSAPLPYCDVYRIRIYSNGSGAVTYCERDLSTRADSVTPALFGLHWIFDPGFWTGVVSTAWKITKCVSYVLVAIAPVAKAYRAIKEVGTVRKVATILVKAGSMKALKKEAPKLAAAFLGIDGIANNCF